MIELAMNTITADTRVGIQSTPRPSMAFPPINRYFSGAESAATIQGELEAMIKFYFSLAPNPMKVALFLEEAGLPYEAIPVDTRKGDQFKPDFLALNPNAKVPVILDGNVR